MSTTSLIFEKHISQQLKSVGSRKKVVKMPACVERRKHQKYNLCFQVWLFLPGLWFEQRSSVNINDKLKGIIGVSFFALLLMVYVSLPRQVNSPMVRIVWRRERVCIKYKSTRAKGSLEIITIFGGKYDILRRIYMNSLENTQ